MEGGPRAGRGAAVRAAMCADGMLCKAYARGLTGSMVGYSTKGGALMDMHSGQSIALLSTLDASSSTVSVFFTTTFIAPEVEQTNKISCGLIIGDAIATPIDNTNHASTKRVRLVKLRSA